MSSRAFVFGVALLASSIGPLACSKSPDDTLSTPSDAAPAALSDAQIAMVMTAANTGEIDEGKVAQTEAQAPAVSAFATRMVTEHTAAKQRQDQLFTKLGLTPADSPVSQQLTSDAASKVTKLKTLSGHAADQAYLDDQVAAHQTVLDLIDTRLLVSVQSADLKTELQSMRTDVSKHLADAKALRDSLGGDAGDDAGTAGDGATTDGGGDSSSSDGGNETSSSDAGGSD